MKQFFALFRKELNEYTHSLLSYVFIVVFLVSLTWLFYDNVFLIGQASMRGFFTLVPWFFLFLVPALSMRLWSEERKQGTIEKLFTFPLSDMQAVLAKFLASFAFLGVVLLVSLPVPFSIARMGNLDWGPVIGSYIGAWLLGGAYVALGQWISSLTKNQIIAFLLTVVVAFGFLLLGLPAVNPGNNALTQLLSQLSTQTHFENLSKGVVALRDIAYYLLFIGFFLYLNMESLAKRNSRLLSTAQTGMLVVIVIVANVLVQSVSLKWDVTEENIYTLSDASAGIVQNLSNPVTFKLYVSDDVPQDLLALKQDVQDLLSEYENAGGSNVIVESADPKTNTTAGEEVLTYGIPEIQYNVVENETFQVSTGYAGLAIVYGEDFEAIPVISDTATLEYDISSAISKMSREVVPTVGVLSDHGALPAQTVQVALEQQYTVQQVTLDELDGIDALIIPGAAEEFTKKDRYALDQFVMNGGALYVFVNGVDIDQQTLVGAVSETKLDELLAEYGVTLNKDILADFGSAQTLTFGGGIFNVLREYPFWPLVTSDGFSDDAITAKLQSWTLPWPSSLTLSEGAQPLAQTTQFAFAYDETAPLAPDSISPPTEDEVAQYVLAAKTASELDSAFSTNDLPEGANADEFIGSTNEANVVVVGNANFLDDSALGGSTENILFVLNAVDSALQEGSLATIRARSALSRPLEPMDEAARAAVKYGTIFSSLLIVLLVGGGVFLKRKKKDKLATQLYG